jgi:hypothetical protein
MGSRRRILVVAAAPVPSPLLRRHVRALGPPAEVEVKVVAPASDLTRLQWLANEEDAAREQAQRTAERAEAAVEDEALVDAEVGDPDPIQAAKDALATFPADELVAVVPPSDEASWLERGSVSDGFEQLGLPVRYVVAERLPS